MVGSGTHELLDKQQQQRRLQRNLILMSFLFDL